MFINNASKLSGATQRAIRLYEAMGLLNVSRSGKYRIYSQENIELIKLIKEAQTLGITLSELVALKTDKDDFDWKLVSELLVKRQEAIEESIKELELQKQRIKNCQLSIEKCVQAVDSDL